MLQSEKIVAGQYDSVILKGQAAHEVKCLSKSIRIGAEGTDVVCSLGQLLDTLVKGHCVRWQKIRTLLGLYQNTLEADGMSRHGEQSHTAAKLTGTINDMPLGWLSGPRRDHSLGKTLIDPFGMGCGTHSLHQLTLLNIKLSLRKEVVIIAVVPMEVGYNDRIDLLRLESDGYQCLIRGLACGSMALSMTGRFHRRGIRIASTGIHQYVMTIALNQKADNGEDFRFIRMIWLGGESTAPVLQGAHLQGSDGITWHSNHHADREAAAFLIKLVLDGGQPVY